MKKIVSILFIISLGFLPIGMIFRIHHWPGGSFIFTLGLFGVLSYFAAKSIKDLVLKRGNKLNITLQALIILMSIILFSKYLYHFFGDYPGLLIVPLFIIVAIIYLIQAKIKYTKLTIASVTFLLFTIPLFGLDFHKSPRQYIPQEWYNRYDVSSGVHVTLPYRFNYGETEKLNAKAFELRESKSYFDAALLYEEARKLEPRNPSLLFDLSETYARSNNLEKAIALLDTAIIIDSLYAGFYNNRGLLYYKLKENDKAEKDYKKAIEIDPTMNTFYANLALVYFYEDLFDKSCESISKAEQLGFNTNSNKELKWIKKLHCK